MKKLLCFIITLMTHVGFSQNVGISASGAVPDPSAMLDIVSSNKGLLIPRVALSALNSNSPIGASITLSLLVYNTVNSGTSPYNVVPGYYYWNGLIWIALSGDGGKNWSLRGNTGTVDLTNFLGTVDNVPLSFRVNNQPAGRVDHLVQNTFLGYNAGNANGGAGNTAIGHFALGTNTAGSYNTATGTYATFSNSNGTSNTANGYASFYNNKTGSNNTSMGINSLYNNISGDNNTAVGSAALITNTTGIGNTALGVDAMYRNKTGSYNTSSGIQSLQYNTTASYNTSTGAFSLSRNTIGESNVAVGSSAMLMNDIGNENTAVGRFSLYTNTSGSYNTAMGYYALQQSTTSNNTGIGYRALERNNSGSVNTAVGAYAADYNTSGYRNVAIGYGALYTNSSGSDNTAIGTFALQSVTTGSNNLGIGSTANVPIASNSNQVRIGNGAILYAGVQVAWTITSDKRWKKEIKPSELGLNFIKALNPVSYIRLNDDSKKTEYGFIAQEMEATLKTFNIANTGIITKDDEGMLSLRYNDLIAITIKALQEQQQELSTEKEKVKNLEERLATLEKILTQK